MNYGKQFEAKFKSDWKKSFPDGVIIRIYDVVSGMRSISNISDFIGYVDGKLYLLECKSHKGASIPFDVISQYEKLKSFVGIPGVRSGVIVWLYEKDKCYYVPVKTITQAKKDKERFEYCGYATCDWKGNSKNSEFDYQRIQAILLDVKDLMILHGRNNREMSFL